MAAHGVALQTDAEQFGFQTGLHARQLLLQDLVEALGENLAVALALHRHVLRAVVHPDIHDGGVALCLTHRVGDAAAALGVLNPELADGGVGIREGEVAALGV